MGACTTPNSVFAAAYLNAFLNGGSIGNALLHFNLKSGLVDWQIAGAYPYTPAYDAAAIHAVNHNPLQLEVRDEQDGSLLWSWTPPAAADTGFVSEVVLTKNTIIVSTNQSTYGIDRTSHRAVWSVPFAGSLALSPSGILYISGTGAASGKITALNVR